MPFGLRSVRGKLFSSPVSKYTDLAVPDYSYISEDNKNPARYRHYQAPR